MSGDALSGLFSRLFPGKTLRATDRLPASGSDRQYYILTADDEFKVIGTISDNIKENQTFINLSNYFKSKNCAVPVVYGADDEGRVYLQEYLGETTLLNVLEKEGYTEEVKTLFMTSLTKVAHMQVEGHRDFDYNWCITSREFGKQAIMADLMYCKYYFIDLLKIPYDKERLLEDFGALANYLSHVQEKYFMFRDFQSRNIMVNEGEVYFIDYQGGMHGAAHYDVASLLWQAKADLPESWKKELLQHYMDALEGKLGAKVNRQRFESVYNGYVLIRLLQVLGAYGLRGIFERKAHFINSIPMALKNLKGFLETNTVGISLPELENVLHQVTDDKVMERFVPVQAKEGTGLMIYINSFSFIKRGYPAATDENGGGFVFDCRGILNPGRFDEYKQQTGRDKPVKDFLEHKTLMPEFLNNVYNIVDISVQDYLQRGFKSLTINFGCTGGQHRSVYAADALARHLRNKFRVNTIVKHLEQNFEQS